MIKKFILSLLSVLALTIGKAMAADPTFQSARDSAYSISQSSVSISSAPTSSSLGKLGIRLPAVSGYRKVKIQILPTTIQDGTSVFYNFGASTAGIYSSGFMVRVSTLVQGVSPAPSPGVTLGANPTGNEIVIESNAQINVMTAFGVAPISARIIQYQLPN